MRPGVPKCHHRVYFFAKKINQKLTPMISGIRSPDVKFLEMTNPLVDDLESLKARLTSL